MYCKDAALRGTFTGKYWECVETDFFEKTFHFWTCNESQITNPCTLRAEGVFWFVIFLIGLAIVETILIKAWENHKERQKKNAEIGKDTERERTAP